MNCDFVDLNLLKVVFRGMLCFMLHKSSFWKQHYADWLKYASLNVTPLSQQIEILFVLSMYLRN